MSDFYYAIPLMALVPVAAALTRPSVVMAGLGLAWAALLGVLMSGSDPLGRFFVGAQVPLLGLCTAMALVYSKAASDEGDDDLEVRETELRALRARQNGLKAEIARIEKDETQSLQIYAVAKNLAEALSWKELAPRLTTGIQKIFGAYEFLLYSIEPTGESHLLHRRGGWAAEPPVTGTLPEAATFFHPPHSSEVVPVLTIPIFSASPDGWQRRGVLFMKSPIGQKNEDDLRQIGLEFGEQLGMTLNKALLFSQMEEHSRIDGLTGVLRRQAFMERLSEEFKRARVFQTPFSLMMIDIDHFKAVNDGHGHAAGDAVLRRVGELLKEAVYETDVISRYGGEEFLILLPKAQRDGVCRKAEALRQRIEREIISSGFESLKITVSVGLSHYPANGRSADELIGQADRALYRAKDAGRNRVVEA